MQLYESKSKPGQLMLYEGGERAPRRETKLEQRYDWWSKQLQRVQMQKLENGLKKLPPESYLANNGKNPYYFIINKIANKAVRLKFGLSKTCKKKDMTNEMLIYRQQKIEEIIRATFAKCKGEIEHMSPLIYDNIDTNNKGV